MSDTSWAVQGSEKKNLTTKAPGHQEKKQIHFQLLVSCVLVVIS
jgi:hypothetical protein